MWADPFTIFGAISIPMFASNILTVLGFFLAAFFALGYTRKFYEGRKGPLNWILIVSGLSVLVASETFQFIILYRVEAQEIIYLYNIISVLLQNIGVILIALGSVLLLKEVY